MKISHVFSSKMELAYFAEIDIQWCVDRWLVIFAEGSTISVAFGQHGALPMDHRLAYSMFGISSNCRVICCDKPSNLAELYSLEMIL